MPSSHSLSGVHWSPAAAAHTDGLSLIYPSPQGLPPAYPLPQTPVLPLVQGTSVPQHMNYDSKRFLEVFQSSFLLMSQCSSCLGTSRLSHAHRGLVWSDLAGMPSVVFRPKIRLRKPAEAVPELRTARLHPASVLLGLLPGPSAPGPFWLHTGFESCCFLNPFYLQKRPQASFPPARISQF